MKDFLTERRFWEQFMRMICMGAVLLFPGSPVFALQPSRQLPPVQQAQPRQPLLARQLSPAMQSLQQAPSQPASAQPPPTRQPLPAQQAPVQQAQPRQPLPAQQAAAQQRSSAQQKVKGTVKDSESSKPVSLVHVINKRTGDWTITGYQGEFEILAGSGDVLAFVKDGYLSATKKLEETGKPLEIALSKKPEPPPGASELLPEVTVYGKSYRADSLLLRQEYERYFPSPPPSLDEAIGSDGSLDLNAYISRMMTPWDREFSQRLLEYEQKKYIDKVFTVERVKQVVDVREEELEEFMQTCRPSYSFLVTATEYDLIRYIRDAYDLYTSAKYGETLHRRNRGSRGDRGTSGPALGEMPEPAGREAEAANHE